MERRLECLKTCLNFPTFKFYFSQVVEHSPSWKIIFKMAADNNGDTGRNHVDNVDNVDNVDDVDDKTIVDSGA